jgi:thiol-disulfide isomerase/thioredoxin
VEEKTGNTSQASNVPESSPPVNPSSPTPKLIAGALLALVLVVGLYYVNRYWIAPAVRAQTKGDGNHPQAPTFSLTDITGKPLKLADYQGKVVMLDFWATWCEPCRIEIPGFIELQKRYAAQGFTMIGISMDDGPEPVVEYYKDFQMNYPVAVGNDRLGELYGGMEGLPTTFLIGRDGRIYAKHVGATDPSVFETEVKELLAASPADEAKTFQQAGRIFQEDKVELGNPAAVDSEVPGIDLTKLTGDQKEAYKKILESQKCTCGCGLNLLKCRQVDRKCGISRKMAQDLLDTYLKDKSPDKSPGVATKSL